MNITILNDTDDKLGDNAEARVGATPDIVKNYVASGHKVTVVKGAGKYANHYDADYKSAGAIISSSNKVACKDADLVLSITGKDAKFVAGLKSGSGITGLRNPTDNPKYAEACAKANVTAFALEYIPRISRAQSMDVLSSQSNLSGYRAVVEGASIYGRAMPMMMTAAGTIAPA